MKIVIILIFKIIKISGKDVDIKLPGTIVELYRVDEEFGIENNIPTELALSTVVGEDGSYLLII
ncbi:MAG: hypothetical protein ACLS85_00690 [Coprobacillus cateniformis]